MNMKLFLYLSIDLMHFLRRWVEEEEEEKKPPMMLMRISLSQVI